MTNVIIEITEVFKQGFILKALFSGMFIAITCALLGVFLVLKNMSLIGDGLAHVSFASIAIALLFSEKTLLLSIPIVLVSSFLILSIKEKSRINADAAIGMLSSFSIAVGVLIASLSNGFNIDLFSYLFGSILFISNFELVISIILSLSVIIVIVLFYQDLFSVSFDESFAKASGIKVNKINYLLSILSSLIIVVGIRVVGTMLISSLIVFPAVSALQLSKGFKESMVLASVFASIAVFLGVISSYILNLPTGASIVCFNAFILFLCLLKRKFN